MALEVRAEKCPWAGRIELLIMNRVNDQILAVAEPISMRTVEPNTATTERPTVDLPGTAAQLLMDDLWRCGIRPSEGSGSAGHLAATQAHLAQVMKDHDRLMDVIFDQVRRDDADARHRAWQELERARGRAGASGAG